MDFVCRGGCDFGLCCLVVCVGVVVGFELL